MRSKLERDVFKKLDTLSDIQLTYILDKLHVELNNHICGFEQYDKLKSDREKYFFEINYNIEHEAKIDLIFTVSDHIKRRKLLKYKFDSENKIINDLTEIFITKYKKDPEYLKQLDVEI